MALLMPHSMHARVEVVATGRLTAPRSPRNSLQPDFGHSPCKTNKLHARSAIRIHHTSLALGTVNRFAVLGSFTQPLWELHRTPTCMSSPSLLLPQSDLGPLPDYTAASFFLAQGLKSLAGGNIHAAMHRLGKAKQALLDSSLAPLTPSGLAPAAAAGGGGDPAQDASAAGGGVSVGGLTAEGSSQDAAVESAGAEEADSMDVESNGPNPQQQRSRLLQEQQAGLAPAVARAVQLATVCGCLGDCYQRLGQPDQAEQQYKESAAAVQPYAEESAEVAHAMSVSLNK